MIASSIRLAYKSLNVYLKLVLFNMYVVKNTFH
jgi:hypothetical protein